jgi:hypothetical protein
MAPEVYIKLRAPTGIGKRKEGLGYQLSGKAA